MKTINKQIMRGTVILCFAALGLGACATPAPTIDMSEDAELSFDGMRPILNSRAAKAWAKPGLDLTVYTKIKLQGAGIEYRPGGQSGRTMSSRSRGGPFEMTEDQKARFQSIAVEVALEELGKSERFTLVDEVGPEVLIVRVALLDVVSFVPPQTAGRSEVFLSSVGEATLVLELRDSITDAILARAMDRRAAGDRSGTMMSRSNSVTNTTEVRRLMRRWMSGLRERLDELGAHNSAE